MIIGWIGFIFIMFFGFCCVYACYVGDFNDSCCVYVFWGSIFFVLLFMVVFINIFFVFELGYCVLLLLRKEV